MPSSIETEINKLLKQKRDITLVADELIKKWRRSELSDLDKKSVSCFLFHSGFYPSLIESIIFSLRKKSKVPWATLIFLLEHEKENIDIKIIDFLFTGAKEEDQLQEILISTQFDDLDLRFKTNRQKLYTKQLNSLREKRKELLAQAEIFHNDGLFEKEREILKRIQLLFNEENPDILKKFDKLSIKQAKEIISKIKNRVKYRSYFQNKGQTQETRALKKVENEVGKKLVQLSKKQPELSYYISIALIQIELFDFALKALAYSKTSSRTEWLKLDLLLFTRQYISAMELAQKLETQEKENSESVFSAMYAKAKALWGLSHKTEAIKLLESILKVRPQYRSSHSLLMQWKDNSL